MASGGAPKRISDPDDEHVIKFTKLHCIMCNIEYYECPECFVMMLQIAAHNCCNSWLENALKISCRAPPNGNLYSRSEYETGFWYHILQEI